ncbi:MAG: SRPBCC family protein [Planctomycetota bacterium]|jgi:ligand-binding SRPBCC domain-containing protein
MSQSLSVAVHEADTVVMRSPAIGSGASGDVFIVAVDKGFRLTARVRIDRPLDEVFSFFADAHNLDAITPPFLSFRVLTPPPVDMNQGTIIDYQLRLRGIPISWQSEISHWNPPHHFVDEQRKGPYRWWVHDHFFERDGDQTVVVDDVSYGVPGGVFVHGLLVKRDLKRIFEYRMRKLGEILSSDERR